VGCDRFGTIVVCAALGVACGAKATATAPDASGPDDASSGASDAATGDDSTFGDGAVAPSLAIAPGLFFTCELMAGGTVRCWGFNMYGMLGDQTTTDSLTPVTVAGLGGVLALSAGGYNACALLPGGKVDCWGDDFGQQLGHVGLTLSPTPVEVPGVSRATMLSVGISDTDCVLIANGTVTCWGANNTGAVGNGQLGGTAGYFSTLPGPVVGVREAIAVSVGNGHACALIAGGSIRCWGTNASGQLGDGTTSMNSPVPVTVSGIINAVAVSAGIDLTCALLSDATVACWGDNTHGELGIGATTPTSSATPVKVPGLSGVTAVSAGNQYACAVLSGGTAKCWGSNMEGTLGNGSTTDSPIPTAVSGLAGTPGGLTGVTGIAASSEHTCAALAGGTFACWGNDMNGQLGNGTTTRSTTPVMVH
jgi:alpha-tubulin suppressor-like RCC1 family protein